MRRIALTATLLLACAGTASAADLLTRKGPALAPLPIFTWTGAYVGAQIGHSWGRDRTREFFTANGAFTGLEWRYNANSVFGGLHAGYNVQLGMFVAGAEGDVDLMDARGGFVDPGGRGVVNQRWQASLRGRLGVAFDRVLLYGTGGAAFSNFKYVYTNPFTGQSEGPTTTRTGYTLGVGAEYAFTDNLTGRLEFRHTDYGSFRYVATSAFLGLTGQQSPRTNALRAGVSYKF
ncbi:MAG: porin family protein [Methylobacteriaceae bacterium]|nr:porin family protein [Methylobacteriaceae bacterium]